MATTVVYPSSYGTGDTNGDANGTAARSLTRDLTVAASIGERVFNSGTGTTMTSGTFSTTPTSGDVLIAVVGRRQDANASNTNPSGWAKLTGAATGSRMLEIWWYRSTGVAADKGSFQWTTAAGTGAWGIELLRIAGSASFADPILETAATSFASTTTPTAQTATPAVKGESPGITLNCLEITGASLSTGGITAAFSGTGTAESTTLYYDATYGGLGVACSVLYRNASYGSATFGAAFTLGAARAGHQAQIHLCAGGSNNNTTATIIGAGINYNFSTINYPGGLAQSYMVYDTSSIPDNNTVTSATLGLRAADTFAGYYSVTDPANATLQIRHYGTSITDTRGNNNTVWRLSPSGMNAKTLLATYPAASAWTSGSDYTLTSTASFPGAINKTGNTVLIATTDDYASATARASRETYGLQVDGTYAPLTIVHNFQATATAAATVGLTPLIRRTVAFTRTAAATLGLTPTVSRAIGYARTVAATIGLTPAFSQAYAFTRSVAASIGNTPAVTRLVAYGRSIAATIDNVPAFITTVIPAIVGVPRTLTLKVRNTLTLVQPDTIRMKIRSVLRLPEE